MAGRAGERDVRSDCVEPLGDLCVTEEKELIIVDSFGVPLARLQWLASQWSPCSTGPIIRQGASAFWVTIVSEFPLESVPASIELLLCRPFRCGLADGNRHKEFSARRLF